MLFEDSFHQSDVTSSITTDISVPHIHNKNICKCKGKQRSFSFKCLRSILVWVYSGVYYLFFFATFSAIDTFYIENQNSFFFITSCFSMTHPNTLSWCKIKNSRDSCLPLLFEFFPHQH